MECEKIKLLGDDEESIKDIWWSQWSQDSQDKMQKFQTPAELGLPSSGGDFVNGWESLYACSFHDNEFFDNVHPSLVKERDDDGIGSCIAGGRGEIILDDGNHEMSQVEVVQTCSGKSDDRHEGSVAEQDGVGAVQLGSVPGPSNHGKHVDEGRAELGAAADNNGMNYEYCSYKIIASEHCAVGSSEGSGECRWVSGPMSCHDKVSSTVEKELASLQSQMKNEKTFPMNPCVLLEPLPPCHNKVMTTEPVPQLLLPKLEIMKKQTINTAAFRSSTSEANGARTPVVGVRCVLGKKKKSQSASKGISKKKNKDPCFPLDNDTELEDKNLWEYEKIVTSRYDTNTRQHMYLIKWKGWSVKHNSWIYEKDFGESSPVKEYWRQMGRII